MKKWFLKLSERWQVPIDKVVYILIVFALTGFTIAYIKKPIFNYFSINQSTLLTAIYYILTLPIYNLTLLVYGFIFGQFNFFWNFEKKMF